MVFASSWPGLLVSQPTRVVQDLVRPRHQADPTKLELVVDRSQNPAKKCGSLLPTVGLGCAGQAGLSLVVQLGPSHVQNPCPCFRSDRCCRDCYRRLIDWYTVHPNC